MKKNTLSMQQTIRDTICLRGLGLHSGEDVTVSVHPAPENHGIVFYREDISSNPRDEKAMIPALWDNVVDTTLCTVISNEHGASVKTIEHLMAALRGCGVDNALVQVDGPELPSLDGSSQFYVKDIMRVGLRSQTQTRRVLKILKDVHVTLGDKQASLTPSNNFEFSGEIDYAHPLIGKQSYETTLVNGSFAHELAATRSFCLMEDVEKMREMGLIKGGSLDNAVVIEGMKILNPGGLRFDNEFIRHKLLDAVGDLYLAGGPILGRYHGIKCGHGINNALLHELFSQNDSYEWVEQDSHIFSSQAVLPSVLHDEIYATA